MKNLLNLISDNFALILSTLVSVLAIASTIYECKVSKRTRAMEMYFRAQLEAYNDFLDATFELEITSSQKDEIIEHFYSASRKAMILSTPYTASVIDNFCSLYLSLIENTATQQPTSSLDKAFYKQKSRLLNQLNNELSKYDKNLAKKAKKNK